MLEEFDDIAIAMYAKGMSFKDISDMIRQIYKVDLSIETINNLTSSVSKEVELWQSKKLEFFIILYILIVYIHCKEIFN